MAGPDYDSEITQLQATMHTIAQVLDLDGMRAEIADLSEQVAAPDLWDDQDNATRVTGRLSTLQGGQAPGDAGRALDVVPQVGGRDLLAEVGDLAAHPLGKVPSSARS